MCWLSGLFGSCRILPCSLASTRPRPSGIFAFGYAASLRRCKSQSTSVTHFVLESCFSLFLFLADSLTHSLTHSPTHSSISSCGQATAGCRKLPAASDDLYSSCCSKAASQCPCCLSRYRRPSDLRPALLKGAILGHSSALQRKSRARLAPTRLRGTCRSHRPCRRPCPDHRNE